MRLPAAGMATLLNCMGSDAHNGMRFSTGHANWCPCRVLYVRNLPFNITSEEVRGKHSPAAVGRHALTSKHEEPSTDGGALEPHA
jgi:hypothetical protein